MKGWRSGDVLAMAAGVALLTAALTPWGLGSGGATYGFAAGQDILFGLAVLSALALIVVGAMRTPWTALVALFAAFTAAFVGFTAAIPAHAQGSHPGFGLFALAAAAVLAMAGCVMNAIEREGTRL